MQRSAVPQAVTGTFFQATQPVSGSLTANAGTNLNTSLLALEGGGNLAAAKVDLDVLAGTVVAGHLVCFVNNVPAVSQSGTWNVTVNAALPAGTNLLGKVGLDQTTPGTTNAVAVQSPSDNVVSLALSNSTVGYTANQCLGGKLTLTNCLRINNGVALLESINVCDLDKQNAPLTLVFFGSNPSGTYNDHSTFSLSAGDLSKVIGSCSIGASNYLQIGNDRSVATLPALGLELQGTGGNQNLYALLMTTGTPTYTTASSVSINFGLLDS